MQFCGGAHRFGGDLPELTTDEPGFKLQAEDEVNDGPVFHLALRPEFQHVAEERQLGSVGLHGREILQRRRHARGVGVVGIKHELVPPCIREL